MSSVDELGTFGEGVSGPPWILGHRGSPLEAPENTLASLRRAVDLRLDGFEYDLRACATGEAILMHDATLERTTDASGRLAERGLPELFGIDAGSWFSKQYGGEPVPLFEEALEIRRAAGDAPLMHMIELKERGLVSGVAERLAEISPGMPFRVASFLRDVCLDARDHDLPAMLLALHANEDDRRFVRDERLAAYGTGPDGWRTPAGQDDWSFCERWAWSVDEPDDQLEACRMPLFGFNSNEPQRALATRALVHLTKGDEGRFPIQTPALFVEPENLSDEVRSRGEWFGSWSPVILVRNPFPHAVEARCGVYVRSGAFEVEGVPRLLALGAGEEVEVPLRITGGSRAPGGDPLCAVQYRWRAGPGRSAGRLLLDAPLHRVRVTTADGLARRLPMLKESVRDVNASMTLRREGRHLFVAIEEPGDLTDPHTVVHLAGETYRGGRGLRLLLPEAFDSGPGGLPFSCGIEGQRAGHYTVRRWAGGVPEGLREGVPGRVLPLSGA